MAITVGRSATRCSTWPNAATWRRSSSSRVTRTRTGRSPGTEWGRDGHWSAEPNGTVPFTTRLLVYRPADPARFNGTVVVSWNNVTAGYELFGAESAEFLDGGYAVVAATVQRVGVDRVPDRQSGTGGVGSGALRLAEHPDRRRVVRHLHPRRPGRRGRPRSHGCRPARRPGRAAGHRHGGVAVCRSARHLRQRHPSARARVRRLPAADLLRGGDRARGRRRHREHQRADRAGHRIARRPAWHQRDSRRPRRAGDGGQLRARSDRLLRGPPARHRPVPVLGVGRDVSCVDPVDGRAGAEVRARVRDAATGHAADEPDRHHAALRRRAPPSQPMGRRRRTTSGPTA